MKPDNILETFSTPLTPNTAKRKRKRTLKDVHIVDSLTILDVHETHEAPTVIATAEIGNWQDAKET